MDILQKAAAGVLDVIDYAGRKSPVDTGDVKKQAIDLFDKVFLVSTLFAIDKLLNTLAAASDEFKRELGQQYLSVQIKTRDDRHGRLILLRNGTCTGRNGIHDEDADVSMVFEDVNCARRVMMGQMFGKEEVFVSAAKNGSLWLLGEDEKAMWFSSLLLKIFAFDVLYLKNYGTKMPGGEMRYVTGTNGGPLFVYVKEGKIVRVTPIELDERDAEGWTIHARGRAFTPPRRVTTTAYALGWKSMVYSKDRILHPMKRVDWDPKGERNPQNRGTSGYERISWEEAFTLVADEIERVRRTHGPGSVFWSRGSHHLWGNIGYFTSAANRFFNCIGATSLLNNPDSWEGFAWGAVHHYGSASRRGGLEPYSTVEDCLQNCEFIVFWSSDPESTSGVYGAQEGTIRREWAKQLGIPAVHIDPYYNATAAFMGGRWICPRPGTDTALALSIAQVWLTEGTYNQKFVAERTLGLDTWAQYVLGGTDGTPKTPEWQEGKTGIPARVARALARQWAKKKTYLSCGGIMSFGSAARTAYGTEWARAMVCLQAMQGFGIPGEGFGGLQYGTPLDSHFWFPGYAEGGFSGDYFGSGAGVQVYNRMPQSPSLNSETQLIPRMRLPEAILEGEAEAHNMSNYSVAGQFGRIKYPAPGHSEVRMHYKYGGSYFGTQPESARFADMHRSEKLETVVSQAIWMEGETRFSDIILPACTNFERWDVGEFANCGGYIDKSYLQNNHRVIHVQHKCIEPLGESKSDFDIFQGIANKLGLWQAYSEGNTQYDWARRHYQASRMRLTVGWRTFLKKGYYVVPPLPEERRDPLAMAWFAEGRKKDTPELPPLPSEYYGRYNEGLSTPSGKFEFEAQTLKRFDPDDTERMPICTYIPSWEGPESDLYGKYRLQLVSPHAKYSFHTMGDSKSSFINEIGEHRMRVDGYAYWIFRMNPADAQTRGLEQGDLVEVYNDRASVICALDITERVPVGVVHSYESCADYRPIGEP
ncbi:MAG: molybdopterin-dependent oxidoreductase, partial [Clostridiales Family XIII bacterium]|nr:molybdopterin-dependent oxidoreductase [Clostridiales Family XIII bacterium]